MLTNSLLATTLIAFTLAQPAAPQAGGGSQSVIACGSVGADHDVGGLTGASAGQATEEDAINAALNSLVPDQCGNCEAPPNCPQTNVWAEPAGESITFVTHQNGDNTWTAAALVPQGTVLYVACRQCP